MIEPALAIAICCVAAVWDLRTGRIPNLLTYSAAVAGLAFAFWPHTELGIGSRLVGVVAAGFPALLLFRIGSLGGGDVKLVAALGAWLGVQVLEVLAASVIVGAVAAALLLGIYALRRSMGDQSPRPGGIPLAPAILLGTLWVLMTAEPLRSAAGV